MVAPVRMEAGPASETLLSSVDPTATATSKHDQIEPKFLFNLESLLTFMFPDNLQHPLAASRMVIFGMYGPLDEHHQLRAGRKGSHILLEHELDTMCAQVEREDLVQVYLHRPRDLGMLTMAEQDALINQADAHLKKEKGKGMLPKITKQDVIELFKVRLGLMSSLYRS